MRIVYHELNVVTQDAVCGKKRGGGAQVYLARVGGSVTCENCLKKMASFYKNPFLAYSREEIEKSGRFSKEEIDAADSKEGLVGEKFGVRYFLKK